MMTQADILAKNDEDFNGLSYVGGGFESGQARNSDAAYELTKPTDFGDAQFGKSVHINGLNESSPIRPSKYFATDSAINTSKGLRNIIIGGMMFSFAITLALIIQIAVGENQVPNRIGIVTQEKVCSDIGGDMVRKGGNSVDAFIAASLCLSVVNPFSAGLGAGGFLLIRDHKHERNLALNCFFKSSSTLNIDDYESLPTSGKKSVAIPGELKCLQTVYQKYARFYWKTLAEPAINLARNGFKASKLLVDHLNELDLENDVKSNPKLSEMFLRNGSLVKENDLIVNKPLADTIELLTKKANVFYEDGEIGSDMVEELNEEKQQLTSNDLKNYAVKQESSLQISNYKDFVMLTTSYPSIGPVLKFTMELIGSISIQISDFKTPEFNSRLLQATKLGYLMSSTIGDPEFNPESTQQYNEKLTLAKEYFNAIVSGTSKNATYPFDESKLNPTLADNFVLNFVSANDHNDLMVSYVGTLGSAWGSKFITKRGFFVNNGLSLFSTGGDTQNSISPDRQPRALMTPILTFNKKNPCIRRFSISYGHHAYHQDDFALSELSQVILKLFTDFSLYETALGDKRAQYSDRNSVCFEDGFDESIKSKILSDFNSTNACKFHNIDLVMKKDHVVYCQVDSTRSNDAAVVFNS